MNDKSKYKLSQKSKNELFIIAKNLKIKNISKLKKANLIDKILIEGDKRQLKKLFSRPNFIKRLSRHYITKIVLAIIAILALYLGYIAPTSKEMNKRFDKIEEKLDNKADFLKYLSETNNSFFDYLVKEYPYGFVMFGIWDGNFTYNPDLKSSDLKYSANWEKTELILDKSTNTMRLTIYDLIMKSNNYTGSGINLRINQIPIIKKGFAYLLPGFHFGGEVNMYLEQLDNRYPENPIYAIGFKK